MKNIQVPFHGLTIVNLVTYVLIVFKCSKKMYVSLLCGHFSLTEIFLKESNFKKNLNSLVLLPKPIRGTENGRNKKVVALLA